MSNPVKNPAKSSQLCRMLIRFRFRPNYSNQVLVPARIPFPVTHSHTLLCRRGLEGSVRKHDVNDGSVDCM